MPVRCMRRTFAASVRLHLRRQHLGKSRIGPLESRRIGVGDIVGENFQRRLLGPQGSSAHFEGAVHDPLLLNVVIACPIS